MLCQKNKFFCDACCDLQEAEKRMKIKKLPNILALHLKRFKYQEDVGKNIKLTYRVAFPFELRLFNTVDDAENPDRLYELFAIVVHIGNGPYHGHYVSIVKARGTWYLFDDDSVEAIKESEIPKYFGESNAGSAYVLYYQAMDLDVTALGVRPPVSIAPPATHAATGAFGTWYYAVSVSVSSDLHISTDWVSSSVSSVTATTALCSDSRYITRIHPHSYIPASSWRLIIPFIILQFYPTPSVYTIAYPLRKW
ncbi:hypothetical protein EW026_g5498 [Hermanssonia centrifuga]|uniref:ubiquitinyl hydrolase 1 n=1 Tax=Hermanssonia centrifuga TaxID=98765 RepID=A0A4V3XA15_9APHY|nr:hypothetical protein EW026_g5498 [Hermanssonia centrifuga]